MFFNLPLHAAIIFFVIILILILLAYCSFEQLNKTEKEQISLTSNPNEKNQIRIIHILQKSFSIFAALISMLLVYYALLFFVETKEYEKTQSSTSIAINSTFSIINEDGKDAFYLTPTVTLTNNQTQSTAYFKLNNNSLRITRVAADGDKVKVLDEVTSISYNSTPDSDSINFIPYSSDIKLNYIAKLDKPGIYYVTFTADRTDNNGDLLINKYTGELTKLFSSEYIYVKWKFLKLQNPLSY